MYRRGEISQVARALRLLDVLRGFKRGRALADLAAALDVSMRTVRRDLHDLMDADVGIELLQVDGRAGACLVEPSSSTIPITRRERFTLLAVSRMFDVLRGTPLHEDVVSVLGKAEQVMNPTERAEHAADRERFIYVPDGGTKAYDGKEDIIDAIQTGILFRRVVRHTYRDGRGRVRGGDLAPFVLLLYRQGLYVIGCRVTETTDLHDMIDWRRTRGVWAVERFAEAADQRRRTFTVPRDFDVSEVLHGAFGVHIGDPAKAAEVVVEFARDRADLVAARQWHPTQRLERLDDGRVRISFQCTNLAPVVSWVLEWGPHACAIAPRELRDAVIDELNRTRALYDAS